MKISCAILLLLFLSSLIMDAGDVYASSPYASRFQEANDLYAGGEHCKAKDLYRELIEAGVRSAALLFNMGNASFRCGDLGQSILYYEKAKKLSPRDDEITFNLAFARSKVAEADIETGIVDAILSRTIFLLSLDELSTLEIVLVVSFVFLGTLRLRSRRRKFKKYIRISVYITGFLLFLSLLVLSVRMIDEADTEAIVVVDHVDALSGPGEQNIKVLSIPEGMKLWVDEERGEWFLIHLSTGRGGWVKKDTIGII